MTLTIITGVLLLGLIISGFALWRATRPASEADLAKARDAVDKARKEYEDRGGYSRERDAYNDAKDYLNRLENKAEKDGFPAFVTTGAFGIAFLIAAVFLGINSFYTQDVGESKVLVNWDGTLVGQSVETGLHTKAPWVSVKTFDVRNNVVSYLGAENEDVNYAGSDRTGPHITFQDREGVQGDMDVVIRYSIDPEAVLDIYANYRTQEQFVTKTVNETIRSATRESTTSRNTIEVYNERGEIAAELQEALQEALADEGVFIEAVNIQEIAYSAEVKQRFDDAQAARIAIDKAEADQEAAAVNAETKVIEAQGLADAAVVEAEGQAEANRLLSNSLTEEILTQRYIDALRESGQVYVVPEGSTPFLTPGN